MATINLGNLMDWGEVLKKLKAINKEKKLDDYQPFVPNNHYAVNVKNYTYEGNIICSGLLMVEDFRKAIRKELDKFSEQGVKIDLFVLPKAAFDRFGDDLTGENYSRLGDEFDIPVWVG